MKDIISTLKVGDMLTSTCDLRPLRKDTSYEIDKISSCKNYITIRYFDGTIPYRKQIYSKEQLVQVFDVKLEKK